jgi:ATP-binding protein involved in chromosome partitioning
LTTQKPRPTEIVRLPDLPGLRVGWSDGHVSVFEGRALRLACACAVCVDEWSGQPTLDSAKVPERVSAEEIRLTGNYGIRVRWSDGHDTGIYTFDRLRALCPCERCVSERSGKPRADEG